MNKSKKGFTLVELLVVIAIIAIIAAVAVPVTIGQINKSKVKTAKNEALGVFGLVEQAITDKDGAKVTKEQMLAYVKENFANPEYVREIKITSSAVEVTTTMEVNPSGGAAAKKVVKNDLGADYAALVEACTLTFTPKDGQTPAAWSVA